MKIGDRVWWVSQSKGYITEKKGVIVAVVPVGEQANHCLPEGFRCNSSAGYGLSRKHESYLVQVDGKGKQAYWPLVNNLAREKRQ